MASIDLYAVEDDLALIEASLRAGGDFARIMRGADGLWRAHRDFSITGDGRHCFWHIPSGPPANPPVDEIGEDMVRRVDDPFAGWRHDRLTDVGLPYFGAGDPSIVWVDVETRSLREPGKIGLTTIGWIGRHYSSLGRNPAPETEKRWNKLRRDLARSGHRLGRGGPGESSKAAIIALPAAMTEMKRGRAASRAPDFRIRAAN